MEKIAIVGPPGAGKTTLSRALDPRLKIKVYHMDRLFWLQAWKRKDRETRIVTLQNLVQEQRWIIEGTYINSSKLHLNAADTIIFLDIFPLICLLRIIKRHYMHRGHIRRDIPRMARPFSKRNFVHYSRSHRNMHSRRDIPEGSTDRLTLPLILKVLFFPLQGRIKLVMNLRKFSREKVIRLHSPKEVKVFLENPELYVYKYRQSVKKRSVLGQAFIIIFDCLLQGFNTCFPYTGYSQMEVLDICEQILDIEHSGITPIYNPNPLQ